MAGELQVLEEVADEMDGATPQEVGGEKAELFHPYLHNQILSNHARFYHPDGTWSDIPIPTYNPKRPTSYRRRVVQGILSRRKNGKRWFYLKPQREPAELPLRCFVEPGGEQCTKRLRNLNDLYMHVMAKHFEESKMYADVLEAMKKKTQMSLEPTVASALSLGETPAEAPSDAPDLFRCEVDGCERFFDTKQGRRLHETKGHK